ncbi:MAG: UDP-N-acetylglucosamine 2-epimerase (non-hydrolyzing) [Candidatus Bathyarchaeota archaeon]|nr:UDP-N-acetylglucosamine 2-epimerase (non-hydrolyzing) [Candidatus Bathyarchaeota archaeon]
MKTVMIVVGTRPEIIKMAPIIRAFQKNRISLTFVNCGQHHSHNMSQQFIEELELPTPDYEYKVKAYSQGLQTASIIARMERLLKKTSPSLVLVEGDTNGVLATALAAVKLGIPVGHVEAGLRSFDLRMPEEHNRRLTDHISTYLFAPTKTSENNLKRENVWRKVYVTGNTVIDAVIQQLPIAEKKSKILDSIRFEKFILATAHRAENVDDFTVLKNFMEAFAEAPLPVVYPMHPRTKKRMLQNKIYAKIKNSRNIQILPPLGYLDFLVLMKKCEIIVTDSGGIQEEATAPCIRKPVLVTRLSTERPETVEAGFAEVIGVEKRGIIKAIHKVLDNRKELPEKSPYGDGKAAERIARIIQKELAF